MSSEPDTPDAGGARSGAPRTPRRAPAKTAAKSAARPAASAASAAASIESPDGEPTPARTPAPKRPASPRKPAQRPSAPRTAAAKEAKEPAAPRTPRTPRTPARPRTAPAPPPSVVRDLDPDDIVLEISGLLKRFGSTTAVAGIDLRVPRGSFYGIVGPNGAGKTTTLSMATGLLRPDGGSISVLGHDVWRDPAGAKRLIGVLPDRLRLFDRLTGRQLLHYAGTLRGLDATAVAQRSDDLAAAFGLGDALGRLVSDYSAGMTKKIALASAMIHSPRLLVLDEPFESVDPVSAQNVVEILERYVAAGGTVVLSSHSMDMIQRVCDRVAIIVEGAVPAQGTVDEVREGGTLEQRFLSLTGEHRNAEGLEWLLSSSD
ncbi:hypothetical protein GCM10009851_03140 [Herbiconiux moechotypicola]|uniref:ABC transporter domain-containing protein n=1 Tax=Herbiconiux moechotypicola TaxID=637393 RepID=A0ABP5Q312_9MICO|nr:ATP-binding cassette domain-containing protein [Herbiconiux moechotypicola]